MACRKQTNRGRDPPQDAEVPVVQRCQWLAHQHSTVGCDANSADHKSSAEQTTNGKRSPTNCSREMHKKQQSFAAAAFSNSKMLLLLFVIFCLICRTSAVSPDCQTIDHAAGSNGAGGCLCQSYYVWVPGTNTCDLSCGLVANSSGVVVSQVQCGCNSNTGWDIATYSCKPSCSARHIYNAIYKACVPDCGVNIAHSDIRKWKAYPNALGYRCACDVNFEWVYGADTCECIIGTTYNSTSDKCDCGTVTPPDSSLQVALALNPSSGKCSCPVGLITNSLTQVKPEYKVLLGYCECAHSPVVDPIYQIGILWDNTDHLCECPNNRTFNPSNQAQSLWKSLKKYCQCPRATTVCDPTVQDLLVWNPTTHICECPRPISGAYSETQAGLVWDAVQQYCECPYSIVSIDLETQAPLTWDSINKYCFCPIPRSPITAAQAAMVWVADAGACQCPNNPLTTCDPATQTPILWNPTLKTCECPATNSLLEAWQAALIWNPLGFCQCPKSLNPLDLTLQAPLS